MFSVSVKTVYKVKEDKNNVRDKKRTGRPRTTRMPAKIAKARALIKANPTTSTRKLSGQLGLSVREDPEGDVKEDLGLKSLVKTRLQTLTPLQRQKCVDRCHAMNNFLKNKPKGRILIFCDEKTFSADQHLNRLTDRYLAASVKDSQPMALDDLGSETP